MSRYVTILVQSLAAVAVILPLAVQAADTDKDKAVVVPQSPADEPGKKSALPMEGEFALIFTKEKGIVVLDAQGKELTACTPGASEKRRGCGNTTNTAINSVNTATITKHTRVKTLSVTKSTNSAVPRGGVPTGSTVCYLIALPSNGGRTTYYDTCTGIVN